MQGQRSVTLGAVAGTPEYMAPERAQGREVDHRSDIYSLGVVAYEMLTGRTLFSTGDPMATLLKHVHARVPVPSRREVPRSLFAPVQQALAKRPEDRWSSALSFVEALERGLGSTVVPSDRTARAARTAAAVGVAAIALFTTLRLSESARSESPSVVQAASPEPARLIATPIARPSESPAQPGPAQTIFNRRQSAPVSTLVAAPRTEPPGQAAAAPGIDDRAPDVRAAGEVLLGEPLKGENVATADRTSVAGDDVAPAPPAAAPIDPIDVVIPPVRIATVQPTYPPVALSAGIEGDVVLLAVVGTDGTVTSVEVVRSAHPLLDDVAKRAVLRYRYKPALRNGAPVSFTVEIPVSFRLQ
jgi:serine/threonine-protein kinase